MGSGRAYLDHAATSPLRPAVLEAMLPHLGCDPANPSGAHAEARRARRGLDQARERLAALLGADFGEVVLTSGGTEADNLAVTGAWHAAARSAPAPPPLVCSALEHHAVLEPCRELARRTGAELRQVAATEDGVIDLAALAEACTPEVALVSVMTVNNELGTVQPLDQVAAVVRARAPRAVLHTDAVQAAPFLDVARRTAGADLVSVSAHKVGGPVGAGALVVRAGTPLHPLVLGGGQERGRRSGTPAVAAAVGAATALEAAAAERAEAGPRVAALRDRLAAGLSARVAGAVVSGAGAERVPGILHLRLAGVEADALVVLLDTLGVAASAGAACSSGAVGPSHVLGALGLAAGEARSGLRLSLGPTTTADEVDLALAAVPEAVRRLRA